MPGNGNERLRLAGRALVLALRRFWLIDGEQRAAAFAFYAFFSLFPLILLFVTAGSWFVDQDRAARAVIAYVESYVPLGAGMERSVFSIVSGVVQSRGRSGAVASAVLFWGALRFFSALVQAASAAWSGEVHNWWRQRLKGSLLLAVMASALLLGIGLPVLAEIARRHILPVNGSTVWIYRLAGFLLPVLVLFYGLSLFYKLAPRRPIRFGEVWPAALLTSVLVRIVESLFVIYVENFARFNAVYGALGGIMALLLWIYLSGCLVVFGACLCAAHAEVTTSPGAEIPAPNPPAEAPGDRSGSPPGAGEDREAPKEAPPPQGEAPRPMPGPDRR